MIAGSAGIGVLAVALAPIIHGVSVWQRWLYVSLAVVASLMLVISAALATWSLRSWRRKNRRLSRASTPSATVHGTSLRNDASKASSRSDPEPEGSSRGQAVISSPDSSASFADAQQPMPVWLDKVRNGTSGFSALLYSLYPPEYQAIMLRLTDDPQFAARMLEATSLARAARVLSAAPPKTAAAVLAEMPRDRMSAVIALIPADMRQAITDASVD